MVFIKWANELYMQLASAKRIVAPLRSKTNLFFLFYFWQKVDQGPKCTLAVLHCKTKLAIFRRDVTNQTFPGREISLTFFYSVNTEFYFMPALAGFPNCQQSQKVALRTFNGLSQDAGRSDGLSHNS